VLVADWTGGHENVGKMGEEKNLTATAKVSKVDKGPVGRI